MKKQLINVFKLIAFIGFAVLLLWLVLRNQNIDLLKSKLKEANYWYPSLALVFAFLSNVIRGYRWNQLIKPLGYKPKIVNTYAALMVGYFTNLGFLRLGEVTRCGVLSKYENIPASKLFGTVIVERVVDVITIFLLLFLVVVFQFNMMLDFSMTYVFNPMIEKFTDYANKGFSFYMVLFVILLVITIGIWFAIRWLKSSSVYSKIRNFIKGFVDGIKTIRSLEKPWLFIANTMVLWFLYFLMSYVCFFSFSATANLGIMAGLTVMVMGGFGYAAPVQGGFGAFHVIVTQTLVLYAIAPSDGLAFAFLVHSMQTLAVIVFGMLSFLVLPLYNRKKTEV